MCLILQTCARARVKELRLGELEVSFFGTPTEELELIEVREPQPPENAHSTEEEPLPSEKTKESADPVQTVKADPDPFLEREREFDELLMSDPERLEELINRGDLAPPEEWDESKRE